MIKIIIFLKDFKRAWDYAKFGWNTTDYDFADVFRMLEFKLARLHKEMERGFGEHEKRSLQSIRICTKLARQAAHPFDYNLEQFFKKHGSPELVKAEEGQHWKIRYPTKYKQKKRQKELLAAHIADEKREEKVVDLLFKIMIKYYKNWWD